LTGRRRLNYNAIFEIQGRVAVKTQLGRRQMLKRAGVLGAVGTLAAIPTSALAGSDDHQEGGRGLVGAWIDTVSSTDTPPLIFQTLTTYDTGGGLTATASIDSTPPDFLSSPTHGAWVRTEGRSYRWFGHAFAFSKEGPTYGT
jgi:hypothetical protein